jgi:hypothetical protein
MVLNQTKLWKCCSNTVFTSSQKPALSIYLLSTFLQVHLQISRKNSRKASSSQSGLLLFVLSPPSFQLVPFLYTAGSPAKAQSPLVITYLCTEAHPWPPRTPFHRWDGSHVAFPSYKFFPCNPRRLAPLFHLQRRRSTLFSRSRARSLLPAS